MSTSTITTITDTILDAQAQALKLFRQSSETTARALETWSDYVTTQSQAFLPEGVDLSFFEPVSDVLPTPTKLVETTFSFAEEFLAQQRELATKVASTTEGFLGAARPVAASVKPAPAKAAAK